MNSREENTIGASDAERPMNQERPIVRESLSDAQSEALRTVLLRS